MRSIFKPALVLMSGRALGFVVTFLMPVVLVRMFDQAEFGTYKQLFLIYFTLVGIAQLGMAESLYYFLPGSPHDSGRYAVNSMLMLAAAGLACLGLLVAARSAISAWMNNGELVRFIPLLGVYLLLTLIAEVLERVMVARKRYLLASLSYGVSDLLRAAFFIVPVVFLHRLEGLLIGAVAYAAVRLCLTLGYLWREFAGDLHPDMMLLRQQLAYALPFELAVLVETLQANYHQYAVSSRVDAATFAIYAVGCLQIPLIDFVAGPACNVMMVGMSEEIRDGRGHVVLAMWHDTTRKLALAFFPLVGLLVVNARDLIVLLFTENYLASVPIFMVWSTAIMWSVLQTDGVLRVYAQTRFLLVLNLIRLLWIAVLIEWLLTAYQLAGGVLATVSAVAVGKGLALLRMKRLLKVGFAQLAPWGSLAAIAGATAAAGCMAVLLGPEPGTPPLLRMLATSLVYTASYAGLVLPLLAEGERLVVTGLVKSWLTRAAKAYGYRG